MNEIEKDFVTFYQKFFERNPEFKNRNLIIGGISFGGIYAPKFARKIVDLKLEGANLRGLFIVSG